MTHTIRITVEIDRQEPSRPIEPEPVGRRRMVVDLGDEPDVSDPMERMLRLTGRIR